MKKAIVIAIIAIVIVAINQVIPDYKISYKQEWENITSEVNYTTLNLREEPDGEVIGMLKLDDKVTLTGNVADKTGLGESLPQDRWVEVTTHDGLKGWIVKEAVPF